MSELDSTIRAANLRDEFHIFEGQCLSVAVAIQWRFGGELIFVTETPYEGFNHALVEIDGRLYDGSGRVGWGETVERFIDPAAREPDVDDQFHYPDDPTGKYPSAYDSQVAEQAYEMLKEVDE